MPLRTATFCMIGPSSSSSRVFIFVIFIYIYISIIIFFFLARIHRAFYGTKIYLYNNIILSFGFRSSACRVLCVHRQQRPPLGRRPSRRSCFPSSRFVSIVVARVQDDDAAAAAARPSPLDAAPANCFSSPGKSPSNINFLTPSPPTGASLKSNFIIGFTKYLSSVFFFPFVFTDTSYEKACRRGSAPTTPVLGNNTRSLELTPSRIVVSTFYLFIYFKIILAKKILIFFINKIRSFTTRFLPGVVTIYINTDYLPYIVSGNTRNIKYIFITYMLLTY